MRILFTRFPLESTYGGSEVQTIALMEGMRERGHEVIFLGSCPVLLGRCKELGIKHQELRIGPPPVTKWGAVSFLWRQHRMREKLEEESAKLKSDAVFMLSLTEKLLLTTALRRHGIPVFWIEHDTVGRWLTRNPWLPRLRSLSHNVTTVVVSDLSRDLYLALGWDPNRTWTIPNGVKEPIGIRPAGPIPHLLRLGCIARLQEEKGVDVLISAVCGLMNVTLEVLGRGRNKEKIRSLMTLCRQANGDDRIRFTSFIPDIERFYARIDVLILPSRHHDPFGMAAAEAMIRGIPVIVTDACGIARHVEPGTEAIVVPAKSAEALRIAISSLRDAETYQRIADAGCRRAEKDFGIETMVSRYEELFLRNR